MNNMETLVEKLNRVQELAKKDPGNLSPAVRGGWILAINEARDQLSELQREYCRLLFDNAYGFFLEGDAKYVDLAAKTLVGTQEGLAVDTQALYKRIAVEAEKLLGKRREWVSDCTAKVQAEFKVIMNELDIRAANVPDAPRFGLGKSVVCNTLSDVVAYVKEMIVSTNGHDFNNLYVQKLIRDLGLKVKYKGNTVPIFVLGANDGEIQSFGRLFKQGHSVYVADVEPKDAMSLVLDIFKSGKKKTKKTS